MISRKAEDVQTVIEKLRSIIKTKQSIETTIGSNTLAHLHDAILLSKILREKVTTLNSLKADYSDLSAEVSEMHADYLSEAEDLVYCVFDAILKDEIKIK